MFNRLTAAIITATISFSATSAFAVNDRVHVNGSCAAYNNRGYRVAILRPGFYKIIRAITFGDGDKGVTIWARLDINGSWQKLNVSSRCLDSRKGVVTRY